MDATIIIPTHERADILLQTLDRLARLKYPQNRWEAVVVDDGSGPETLLPIADWVETSHAPVRVLRQSHRGPAAARNRGARDAAGEVLIFLDNDCLVPPDFVGRHLEVLRANPGCWVVGRLVHPSGLRVTPFGRYRDDCWEAFHRSHPEASVSETAGMTAANLAVPAADFARLGGFDEEFSIASCEDWDLAWRARQAGTRILYDPGNVAVHNDWAVNLDRFCERQRLYSISDVLLWRKYGESSPRAQLVRENGPIRWSGEPPLLVFKKLLKRFLATVPGTAAVRWACTVAERALPDSRCGRRLYDLAVGLAIFRGVREGLTRYDAGSDPRGPNRAGEQDKARPRSRRL